MFERLSKRLSATPLLLLAAAANCAHANWQFTRWGMSVEEVKNASGGNAKETPNRNGSNKERLLLRGTYQAPAGNYTTSFFFAGPGDTLNRVNLEQQTSLDCSLTIDRLREKYGSPEVADSRKPNDNLTWRDHESGNLIRFNDLSVLAAKFPGLFEGKPDLCVVSFLPIGAANANGL